MFLSVIIPIYNVEKYLRQCIDSVINQNLPDIEIILVDDGSPDKCPMICDEYGNKYDFVQVVHKKNGGLSSARNAGFEKATGDYIMFLDSDDWWNASVDMNAVLNIVHESCDVEMFLLTSLDYVEGDGYYKRNEHKNLKKIRTSSVEVYFEDLLNNGNLEVHAATKILRRDFINDNNLLFKPGIVSEDNEWILRLLRCLHNVKIIDEPIYIYRSERVGSITNSIKKKNVGDLLSIINSTLIYYMDNPEKRLKDLELCYCSYLWFSALGLSYQLTRKERNELLPFFKKTSSVCAYSVSSKTKLAYRVYKVLGLRITAMILGKYISIASNRKINKNRMDNYNESIGDIS